MNDFLYDSFGSSDLVDPFLEEEEKNKKREDSGLLEPPEQQTVNLEPPAPKTSAFSAPGIDLMDIVQEGADEAKKAQEEEQLNSAMDMGLQENVEDLSKNDHAAKELELPMEVVEGDPEGAARQLQIKHSKELLEMSPKTKKILMSLEKGRGLTQSVEELSLWEIMSQDAEHGWTQGERILEIGRLGFEAKHTQDPVKRKEYFEKIREVQAAMATAPETHSYFGGAGFIGSTAEQLAIMREFLIEGAKPAYIGGVANLAGFVAAGANPAMALYGLGYGVLGGFLAGTAKFSSEFEEGGSYIEMLNEGIDPEAAFHISTGVGVINGLLEIGAFGVLAKPVKDALVKTFINKAKQSLTDKTMRDAFKKGGKVYLQTIAAELGIELAQETTNIAGSQIGQEMSGKKAQIFSEKGRGEIFDQYLEIADKTLKSLLLIAAPTGAITIYSESRDVKNANQAEWFMKAIGDSAQSSEAAEKLPKRLQDAVEEIVKDGPMENVYINANEFQEVFQENTEAVAEELGIADQLEANLGETNGSLEVPIGVYATKVARDKEAHAALIEHSKFDPLGQTPAEAKANNNKILEDADKIIEATERREEMEQSADLVSSFMKKKLEETGRHTPEQVEQEATLHRAFAIVMGDKIGKMPHEVYEEVGLTDVESVTNPLVITRADYEAQGVPSTESLEAEGYDAVRIEGTDTQAEQTIPVGTIKAAEGKLRPETQTLDQAAEATKQETGFEEFIKDSKVVDEKGEPKVVYHGTAAKDFKEFDTDPDISEFGSHFGTVDQANDVAHSRVIPVYLNIKNPLRIKDAASFNNAQIIADTINDTANLSLEQRQEILRISQEFPDGEDLTEGAISAKTIIRKKLEEWGYDGIVYKNEHEGLTEAEIEQGLTSGDSYIAFHPEQIKSIHAKKFDPTSPDILEQQAAEATKQETGFEEFIKDTKVVDEKGEPLVVYHGTAGDFSTFDKSKQTGGNLGDGLYFSPQPGTANRFARLKSGLYTGMIGANVMPVYLSLKNPKVFENPGELLKHISYEQERDTVLDAELLKSQGYDGVILKRNGSILEGEITVFEPNQIKSIHAKKFDPGSPDILEQSAVPIQKKPLKIKGTGKKGQITNWDIGEAFTQRHEEKYGRKLDPQNNEEDYKIVLRELNKEYKDQAKQKDAGADWYIQDINDAVEITKLIIPELSDPVKKDIFLGIVAFTSPNNDPKNNWEVAVQVMKGYVKTGKIPTQRENGKELGVGALKLNMQLFQQLISNFGEEGALEWISEPKTGREMAQLRMDSGLYAKKKTLAGYVAGETNLSTTYPFGAAAMGPKVSEFFANVIGLDQNSVTVDLWASRTYNRMIGRLLDVSPAKLKSKKIVQDVRGKAERDLIKRLFRDLAKKNNVDPSAMQAALWYFEQRLFRNHGATASSENFTGGATRAARTREIDIPRTSEDAQGTLQDESGNLQELYQEEVAEEVNPTWYYSTLLDAVTNLKPSKAQDKTAEEWMNIIRKLPGVKQEEIAATGLEDYLGLNNKKYLLANAEKMLERFEAQLKLIDTHSPSQYEWAREKQSEVQKRIAEVEADLKRIRKERQVKFTHDQIKQYLNDNGPRLVDITNGIPQDESQFAWYQEKMEEIDEKVQESFNNLFIQKMQELAYDFQYDRAKAKLDKILQGEDPNTFYFLGSLAVGTHEEVANYVHLQITNLKADPSFYDEVLDYLVGLEYRQVNRELSDAFYYEDPGRIDVLEKAGSLETRNKIAEIRANAMRMAEEEFLEVRNQVKEKGETKFKNWSHKGGKNYTEWLITLPVNKMAAKEPPPQAHEIRKKIVKWAEMKVEEFDARDLRLSISLDQTLPIYQKKTVKDFMNLFEAAVSDASFLTLKSNSDIFTKEDIDYYLKSYARNEEYFKPSRDRTKYWFYRAKEFKHDSHFPNPNILVHVRFDERKGVLYIQEIQSDWADARREKFRDTPAAPFVDDTQAYTALALKRMIHHAISQGFDRIEWTTGIQQDQRYEMSQFIDGILWNPDTKILQARPKDGAEWTEVATNVEETDLPKYVGGEVAAKLVKSERSEVTAEDIKKLEAQRQDLLEVQSKLGRELLWSLKVGDKFFGDLTNETQENLLEIGGRINIAVDVGQTLTVYEIAARSKTLFETGISAAALGELGGPIDPDIFLDLVKTIRRASDLKEQIDLNNIDVDAIDIQISEARYAEDKPDMQVNDKILTGVEVRVATDGMRQYYDTILPSVTKKVLKKLGVKNPQIEAASDPDSKTYDAGKQPGFDLAQVRQTLKDREGKTKKIALFQKDKKIRRGSFRADWADITKDRRVMTLLEDANLSTFLHETGHFFFEATRHFASQAEAPQELKDDMNALLNFVGVSDLATWNNMSFEERRSGHEQVARAFEAYLYEGKAPTPELQGMFQTFREWLIQVYKSIQKLNVTLNDDVRNVFDRMLATKEEIEANRQFRESNPLFDKQPEEMDNATWKAYQATVTQAENESEEELAARVLRNMRWESGARGRIARQMQREERSKREGVKLEATRTISEQDVYQAKAFLRQPVEKKKKVKSDASVVDPYNDNLFTAIAKLGGLDKDEVIRVWGLDPKDKFKSGLGATRPVWKKDDPNKPNDKRPKSIDEMGILLSQEGMAYLPVGEDGKYDPADFEERFMNHHSGNEQVSLKNDEWDIAEAYENFVVGEEGLQPLDPSIINGKLSIPLMEELYGAEEDAAWRQLPKGRYGMVAEENGLHPDKVAERFNFSSGDEMIKALLDAKPLREAVDAETDRRMLELYGDMNTPEQREQAINKALYNETTTRRIHAELAALSKGIGGNVLAKEARAWAEEKISRMTPRSIRPSVYFAQERRENRKAERALAKGDRKAAQEHKRSAVLNFHFAKAAVKALEEVDKAVRYFNSFDRKGTQKTVAIEQLDQIYAILEKYDLRKSVTKKDAERRVALREWIAQQEKLGLAPNIDPRLIDQVERQPYKDTPMEELRGLRESIRSIEHLGRLKNKLLVAKGERDLDTAVGKVVKEIIENSSKKKRYIEKETETRKEKRKAAMRGVFAAHRKFGDILRQFAGWKFGGASFEFLMRPIEERTQWKNEQKVQADIRLAKIFNKYTGRESRRNAKTKIYIEGLGESLTKNGMLAIALNWGNPANQQRLIGDPLKGGHGWNHMQIQAVLDQLDKRDWDFVQEVWDFIDEYWELIEAKEKRVSGVAPEKVEAMPINTRFGQYRGGYYPIKYNRKLSREAHKHYIDDFAEDMKRGAFSRAMTKHGFAKERVNEVYSPVRLDLGVIMEHLTEVINDLAYHEVLVDTGRFLNHPSFRDTVEAYYSFEIWEQLGKAITDMALGDVPAAHQLEKILNHLKSGSTIAGLMHNLGTVVLQPLGLTQSMALIGSKWVFKGMARFFVGGQGMESGLEWIQSVSPFMRNRAININREISEYQNKITGERGNVIKETGFYLMLKAQLVADVPTWLGMYEKVMAEGVDGKRVDEATAIILADRAVKDSQGSGDSIDLAAVQRGGPGWKILTQFYSFFSVLYQRMHESVHKTKFTNPLSIGRLAVDMFLLVSLPVTLEILMRDIALKGGCDNGDDLECVAEKMQVGHLTYFMGAFIGLREISGGFEGYGYSGPSGSRIFSEMVKLIKQVEQQEWDRALYRSLNQVGGIIFHYPAAQLQRAIDTYFDYEEGKDIRPTAPLFGQSKE